MAINKELVRNHRLSGLSYSEIGKLFGVSHQRIYKICGGIKLPYGLQKDIYKRTSNHRKGLIPKNKGKSKYDHLVKDWEKLIEQGWYTKDIAEKYGLTKNIIIGTLNRKRKQK